jgi:hypothetical protein
MSRRVKLITCNVLCPRCQRLYQAEIAVTHYHRHRKRFPHLPPLMCVPCLNEKCAGQAEREKVRPQKEEHDHGEA